jgi:probable HAF family extracellular repeat protein
MRFNPFRGSLIATALLVVAPATALAQRYTITDLGTLGTSTHGVGSSRGAAVNEAGHVAGHSAVFAPDGTYLADRPFLWRDGVMIDLGALPAPSGYSLRGAAVALNDAGDVVGKEQAIGFPGTTPYDFGTFGFFWSGHLSNLGTLGTPPVGRGSTEARAIDGTGRVVGHSMVYDSAGGSLGERAFLWSGGSITNLGTLGVSATGWARSQALAINSTGRAVGFSTYHDAAGNLVSSGRAVSWHAGTMTDLGVLSDNEYGWGGTSIALSINAAGQVVGESWLFPSATSPSFGGRAVLWDGAAITNLGTLGTSSTHQGFSSAVAVNDAGQVIGYSYVYDADGAWKGQHAFLWQAGHMRSLGVLNTDPSGRGWSFPTGINASGQVIGSSRVFPAGADFYDRAFLWQAGRLIDLTSLLPADSGWELRSATDINDSGQITGTGRFHGQERAFLLTPAGPARPGPLHNTSPVAVPDTATVAAGATVRIVVLANDMDRDGDPLTITAFDAAGARGGAIARDGNVLVYTAPGEPLRRPDTFTYTIGDGRGGTAVGRVTVHVR